MVAMSATPPSACHPGEVSRLILHITTASEWAAAQAAGEYRAPSLDAVRAVIPWSRGEDGFEIPEEFHELEEL